MLWPLDVLVSVSLIACAHVNYGLCIGARSFNRRSLHHIGEEQNPYEQAIAIIGQTLSSFDEDNMIPCFGFGDGISSKELCNRSIFR